jgi:hypothetical protein
MKALNKAICTITVLALLLSTFSFADDTFDANKFDYNNPEDYNALGVDEWKQLNQKLVPINQISLIPPEVLDYSQIKDDEAKRQALTVEQIKVNLEKIDNLAGVNIENARQAISEKHSVSVVSFGKSAKIENGVLKANEGDFVFLGKNGWEIEVDGETGRIKVLKPKDISKASISKLDYFTLTEETSYTPVDGSAIKVKQLSFKEGISYVQTGEEATIGDYKIPASGNPVDIYFDATVKPTGNYVVITDKSLDIGTTKDGTVRVIPQPGNKLFWMVKRQYEKDADWKPIKDKFIWVPDERDTLDITVKRGDGLVAISRESEGKTPLMRHHDGGGATRIETGRDMTVLLKKGKLNAQSPSNLISENEAVDERNSVAFELYATATYKSTPLISRDEIIRTSTSNRYVHEMYDGELLGGNNMGLEVSSLIEPNMMKTKSDLEAKYPHFEFNIKDSFQESSKYFEITSNMAQVVDEWLRNNEGVEKYTKKFYFNRYESMVGLSKFPLSDSDGGITLGEQQFNPEFMQKNPIRDVQNLHQIVDHEFVHIQEKYLYNKESDLLDAKIAQFKESKEFKLQLDYWLGSMEETQSNKEAVAERLVINQFKEEQRYISIKRKIITEVSDDIVKTLNNLNYPSVKSANNLVDSYLRPTGLPFTVSNILGATDQMVQSEDFSNVEINELMELNMIVKVILHEKEGIDSYSFKPNMAVYTTSTPGLKFEVDFPELLSTYSEHTPNRAAKNKPLAQFEYDRIMSLDPPEKMRKKAENRYYNIMGGKEGAYCKENGCGPCKIYTLACKP